MENINKHFVKYPHGNEDNNELNVKEGLIYVTLRYFDRGGEVYPSLKKLSEMSGFSIKTIDRHIVALIDKKYINRKKVGRKFIYTFLKTKEQFERFSDEFILNPKLTASEKAYIVAITRFMFKNPEAETGEISFSNKELSEKIHLSERSIIELNKSLEMKSILQNASEKTKKFNLRPIDQLIILELSNCRNDIEYLKEQNKDKDRQIRELKEILEKNGISIKIEKPTQDLHSIEV